MNRKAYICDLSKLFALYEMNLQIHEKLVMHCKSMIYISFLCELTTKFACIKCKYLQCCIIWNKANKPNIIWYQFYYAKFAVFAYCYMRCNQISKYRRYKKLCVEEPYTLLLHIFNLLFSIWLFFLWDMVVWRGAV